MTDDRMLIDAPMSGPFAGLPALEAWRAELAAMPDDNPSVQLARREVDGWIAIARGLDRSPPANGDESR